VHDAVHLAGHVVRVGDAGEPEAGAGLGRGVEVDRADAEDALQEALGDLDVLHPVDARLLDAPAEDAAADVQAAVGDRVARGEALEVAPDQHDHEHGAAGRCSDARVLGQVADRERGRHGQQSEDVEAENRAPRGAPLEDHDLAGIQVHGLAAYPRARRTNLPPRGGAPGGR
jgi:hypothetical protein